jgi:hypothetical protein
MISKRRIAIGGLILAGAWWVLGVGIFDRKASGQSPSDDPTAQAEQDPHAQHGAIESMSDAEHVHHLHMKLTGRRPLQDSDERRAAAVVEALRRSLSRYRDANAARRDA